MMTNRIAPYYEPVLEILETTAKGSHRFVIDPMDVFARRELGLRTDYRRFEVEAAPDETSS